MASHTTLLLLLLKFYPRRKFKNYRFFSISEHALIQNQWMVNLNRSLNQQASSRGFVLKSFLFWCPFCIEKLFVRVCSKIEIILRFLDINTSPLIIDRLQRFHSFLNRQILTCRSFSRGNFHEVFKEAKVVSTEYIPYCKLWSFVMDFKVNSAKATDNIFFV